WASSDHQAPEILSIFGPGCIVSDIFEINVSTNIDNIKKIAYFMKLVGWEQLAAQGVPRWQVHKRVASGSQRKGSVASPV
ncbi:hypothetical protein ACTNB0_10775, partial [Lachnospiraceae bacterium HCP28S3_F9]